MVLKLILVLAISLILKGMQGKRWYYYLPIVCVYIFLILSITLMEREVGGVSEISLDLLHKYAQMFTKGWWGNGQYIAREIIGNVILFIPLGQLLSVIFRGKYLPLIAILGFFVSLAIEITQYRYGLGTFEVADLIHNTLGAVCGYYIYKTDFYLKGKALWNHIRSRCLRR